MSRNKIILLAVAGIVALLFGSSEIAQSPDKPSGVSSAATSTITASPSGELKKEFYTVTKVIDGDTVTVMINGKPEMIRAIGMDSPETVDPRKPVQCYGREASDKAKAMLAGKRVSLEADPTQGERDKYNRLLRFIFLEDGTNFNMFMISEGYAHEYTYQSKPYTYQKEFMDAEKSARESGKGLWAPGACVTPTPTVNVVVTPTPVQPTAASATAGGGNYPCNCAKTCTQISSCDEAMYLLTTCGCSARDADGDGIPCESLCQ